MFNISSLNDLLANLLKEVTDLLAALIIDQEGLIIAQQSVQGFDEEIIGAIMSIIEETIKKIKKFTKTSFGSGTFVWTLEGPVASTFRTQLYNNYHGLLGEGEITEIEIPIDAGIAGHDWIRENDSDAQAWVAAFREGLQKLGWVEDRNIRFDTRWASPDDAEARQRSAKELVALRPDLILSQVTPTTAALRPAQPARAGSASTEVSIPSLAFLTRLVTAWVSRR